MDTLTKIPGLQHIAEEIFMNLDYQSLLKCQNNNINQAWKKTLKKIPSLWLRKCIKKGVLTEKETQSKWTELIKISENSDLAAELTSTIVSYLMKIHTGRISKNFESPLRMAFKDVFKAVAFQEEENNSQILIGQPEGLTTLRQQIE